MLAPARSLRSSSLRKVFCRPVPCSDRASSSSWSAAALPGGREDVSGCRRFEELPDAARRYVDRVEALAGVPVDLISIGPNRDETITRADPFRPA